MLRQVELPGDSVVSEPFICTNPKHSHGAGCYSNCKCRCAVCLKYNSRQSSRYQHERSAYLGKDVWVDAKPTMLRLRALAWMGWSTSTLAAKYGVSNQSLAEARQGKHVCVRRSTHSAVAKAFKQLAIIQPTHRGSAHARLNARELGWASPMRLTDKDLTPRPFKEVVHGERS